MVSPSVSTISPSSMYCTVRVLADECGDIRSDVVAVASHAYDEGEPVREAASMPDFSWNARMA